MGCDCETYWIKPELIKDINAENWWCGEICKVPRVEFGDDVPEFYYSCKRLYYLASNLNYNTLYNGPEAWVMFELNLKNIDFYISKAKDLLCETISHNKDNETIINTERLVEDFEYCKMKLELHNGYSLLVIVSW